MKKNKNIFSPKSYDIKGQVIISFTAGGLLLIILAILLNTFNQNKTVNLIIIIIITMILFITAAYVIVLFYELPFQYFIKEIKSIRQNEFETNKLSYHNLDYCRLQKEINMLSIESKETLDKLKLENVKKEKYAQELERDVQNKKYLVQSVSHDIKTPLAVIQATTSAILDGIFEGDAVNPELLNILKEVSKTSEMLQEIMSIYKIEGENYKIKTKNENLSSILTETIYEVKTLAIKYNQTIKTDYDEKVFVNVDLSAIKKVVSNLILNAIIYSPKGSIINVNINKFKTTYVLEIINHGVVIPPEKIDDVFEPFYRVDESRNKKEDHGNGLGLYVVKQILTKHQLEHGIVNINNGVKFYIIFPRSR